MKALTIKFEHGRIWTVETSDGRHFQGASLINALDKIMPKDLSAQAHAKHVNAATDGLWHVFDGITDSRGASNIVHGQAAG